MRKPIKAYDVNHRALVEDRSIVRYEDVLWIYHGSWIDTKTNKIKTLISSRRTGKMRLVHDRDRHKIELEFTVED